LPLSLTNMGDISGTHNDRRYHRTNHRRYWRWAWFKDRRGKDWKEKSKRIYHSSKNFHRRIQWVFQKPIQRWRFRYHWGLNTKEIWIYTKNWWKNKIR